MSKIPPMFLSLIAGMILLGASGALPTGSQSRNHGGSDVIKSPEVAASSGVGHHGGMLSEQAKLLHGLHGIDDEFYNVINHNKRISDADYMEFLMGKMKRQQDELDRRGADEPGYWDFVLGDTKRSS